jgi:hypothetical protein
VTVVAVTITAPGGTFEDKGEVDHGTTTLLRTVVMTSSAVPTAVAADRATHSTPSQQVERYVRNTPWCGLYHDGPCVTVTVLASTVFGGPQRLQLPQPTREPGLGGSWGESVLLLFKFHSSLIVQLFGICPGQSSLEFQPVNKFTVKCTQSLGHVKGVT